MKKKTVSELHDQAMRIANEAFLVQFRGEDHKRLFKQAFLLEREAAMLLVNRNDVEPTRSILFKSAAVLALDCELVREAERLIAYGLAGNPSDELADDLRDLYDDINFRRHLELRGLTLSENEFQLTLHGNCVGHGEADTRQIIPRLDTAEKLIKSTIMRKMGLPFKNKDNEKIVNDNYIVLNSVARASSYAVTFKLGTPLRQLQLDFPDMPKLEPPPNSDIISDMVNALTMYENGDFEGLEQQIQEESYYDYFTALTKNILPDGSKITLVGVTANIGGSEKKVSLRKTRNDIRSIPMRSKRQNAANKEEEIITLRGTLKFANSLHRKHTIKIKYSDHQESESIRVSDALMDDIVKPLWNNEIEVTAVKKKNYYVLKDIMPVT